MRPAPFDLDLPVTILGIDIGGSGIKGAPVDTASGKLLDERHRIKTPQPATPAAVAKTVKTLVDHFNWQGPVGAAFPARIKSGVAKTASNIDKAFIGTDVAALFEKETGQPFYVLNDADAAGVAEMHFGAARAQQGVVMLVTVGTGIGSALFVDGTLVPNTELGWLMLPNGQAAEPYASDRVRKGQDLTWKQWAGRFQEYLDRVEFLFSPDLIVVGGGISKPERWSKFSGDLKTNARLVPAMLRNDAGIIGAAQAAQAIVAPLGTAADTGTA